MSSWPQLSAFNAFDWVVIVILSLSALLSLWRGFVREAFSLAGWVLAFIVANLGAVTLADAIGDLIANRTGRYIVAWALLFVVVLVSSSIAAKLLSKVISASGLGVLDRMLGMVFGFLRGALIVMALVFVVREVIPESERSLLAESELMPHVDVLLSWTMRTFEEFKDIEIKGLNA
jgi:membrane protein required for colicin V production